MTANIGRVIQSLQNMIEDRLFSNPNLDRFTIFSENFTKVMIEAWYEQDLCQEDKSIYSKEQLINDLTKLFKYVEPTNAVAESNELETWLDNSIRINSETRFNFYKKYLIKEKKGDLIQQLDADTFKILDSCHDPRILDRKWNRRGLVYGHVQSGKTANYIGLINRAFDAGYRIVIVLTGMTEDLRRQTQARIDSGVVGKSEGSPIGIGTYENFRRLEGVIPATSIKYDLSERDDWRYNNIDIHRMSIWVIKKNKKVLENLILWLDKQRLNQNSDTINNCPFLIIDDEADNASIQALSKTDFELWETGQNLSNIDFEDLTESQEEILNKVKQAIVSAINSYIRVALSLMSHKTFVAYTATPYSIITGVSEDVKKEVLIRGKIFNIDINSNLFPEHFIIPIKPGNNYIGIERVFNTDPKKRLPIIVDLNEDPYNDKIEDIFPSKKGMDYSFSEIPKSLEDAIIHFLLTIIIKKHRGHQDYNTLLIHTSNLTKNADYVADKVSKYLIHLKNNLTVSNSFYDKVIRGKYELIKETSSNNLFKNYFGNADYTFPENICKEDIINTLDDQVQPLDVVSYHSSTDELLLHKNHQLNYDKKNDQTSQIKYKNYVVIGGNRLSRGLTLEGLTTSYFVRNSTRQDSLYQMGRWFGYRNGYEDLVRIFIPKNQILWFEAIFKLEMDLRQNFEENNADDSKILPRDAIIKLAYHTNEQLYLSDEMRNKFPSICDPNKLRHTKKESISFSGTIKSNKIIYNKELQLRNIHYVRDFMLDVSNDVTSILVNNSDIPYIIKNNNLNFINVNHKYVLQLLNNYEAHIDIAVEFDSLSNFISENNQELNKWSIVLAQKPGNSIELNGIDWNMNFYNVDNNLVNQRIKGVQRKWKEENFTTYKTISSFLDSGNIDNSFDIINSENLSDFEKNPIQTLRKFRSIQKKPILIIYPVVYKDLNFPLLYFILPVINGGKRVQYLVRNNRNALK